RADRARRRGRARPRRERRVPAGSAEASAMALKRSFFDRVNEVGLSELLNRAVRAAEAAKEGEDWVDRLARAARAFVEALPPALPPDHKEAVLEAIPFGLHLLREETFSVARWHLEPRKIERAQRLLDGRGVLTLSLVT